MRHFLVDTLVIYGASKVQDLLGWPRDFWDMAVDLDRLLTSLGRSIDEPPPQIVTAARYQRSEKQGDTREERSMKISSKWDAIPTHWTTLQAEAVSRSVTGILAKK